ncbi:MAG: hypothetical protein GEU81_15270 [Nitriliruptorales bacterium]|nr:hypothetical protein [Nitriliruptorales bacterium]
MEQGMQPQAMVQGVAVTLGEARLAMTDEGVARGDGAFETVGVWDGRPFRLHDHLERLASSLAAIGLPPTDLGLLAHEAGRLLARVAPPNPVRDGALRFYVTGSGTRVIILSPPPPRPVAHWLVPQPAPWIRPLGTYAPAGAKTMSYGPNMAATRAAVRAGGDDALLTALEGYVLEGPTFGVLWVRDDIVHAPDVALGIVDSISRRTVLEAAGAAGMQVEQGRYGLDALAGASEFLICSAVRDVLAILRVGEQSFPGPTPVRDLLSKSLERARRA